MAVVMIITLHVKVAAGFGLSRHLYNPKKHDALTL